MLHQFVTSAVLGQAIPPQTSMLAWMLTSLGSLSGLLVILSGLLLFAGAWYLVATRQRPAVLAAYLVLMPVPVLISICGFFNGSIASLVVIAATPDLQLTSADIAGGLASGLFGVFFALLISTPTYLMLAIGLLFRTWDGNNPSSHQAKVVPSRSSPPDAVGLPLAPA